MEQIDMKRVAIHQPQYLPYLGFFHKIYHCDCFVVLDDVQYQNRGVQNRNKIKTSSGWQWLTVPVQSHSRDTIIKDILINQSINWPLEHWKSLKFNYSNSPFFSQYGKVLKNILTDNYIKLLKLNMTLIEWIMSVLKIEMQIVYASELGVDAKKTERLVNLCQAVEATEYYSGPGGRNYMDLSLFAEAGIKVSWQEFVPPVYEQLFPKVGFEPNLSVVDLLFNCGPAMIKEFLDQ